MGIERSSVVAAPLDEVFAWFARPGALTRLSPPWQPVTPVQEADSLADGRAVLRLPGGLRWVAQHDPRAYDPPHRFVDEIAKDGPASVPAALTVRWRHTHEFEAVDDRHTRVVDRVDTPVPAALARSIFDYRYRQLADDLAAHQRAAQAGLAPLTIAVTGASGLVGTALTAFLSTGGHTVIRLVRRPPRTSTERQWDPDRPAADLLDGVDAVIHLAGASIAGRFTEQHRRDITDSRIGPTRALAETTARAGVRTFVCASAIGYYGYDRGDTVLTEDSDRGDGFLADVVAAWEDATAPAADAGVRVTRVRTGIVQSPRGGTLRLLRPLFTAGLGGRLGDGRQWLSWIGIDDLIDVYHRALWDDSLSGPVNAVAPNPVRNTEYTRVLAATVHRPALLPVPGFGPKLLLGDQGARELATAGQRVDPARLRKAGHHFRTPGLDTALAHLLGRG
ncbi:TIGR01777 family oxidoreductase [Nocardia huaxiensis]|uniref:TIGR01777 family protein n=1 Tax=Nocardia huaxiensis TaxID=2755382 RepID=A0A7D6Z7F8_9NOCA|nr:TIGR01777 family oxidoreductase [Nocardia huaxiensis]QLY28788.1 TIGR01777 family protein [Nocardia huaxiensis]UFS97736.1 TIGR01777 family oxidoreductase [Nocardia huaxiensis]